MMLANPTRQMFAQQTTAEMDGAGIDHHNHPLLNTQRPRLQRKRKAEIQPENNERLSKRMSLLNLEQGGTKLYVPVENPGNATANPQQPTTTSSSPLRPTSYPPPRQNDDDDTMQLDDSKYKVYIYNMEDELSSESEAEADDGKLVFLPDIEKHMRTNRILPSYMLNDKLGGPDPVDLAQMQMVLYNIPSSISVPEEQDSVRKAIIEARARMREKLDGEKRGEQTQKQQPAGLPPTNGFQSCAPGNDDPDAMELD